jgi:hypothetical protein
MAFTRTVVALALFALLACASAVRLTWTSLVLGYVVALYLPSPLFAPFKV